MVKKSRRGFKKSRVRFNETKVVYEIGKSWAPGVRYDRDGGCENPHEKTGDD